MGLFALADEATALVNNQPATVAYRAETIQGDMVKVDTGTGFHRIDGDTTQLHWACLLREGLMGQRRS
jgi:hypothetical protein